MFGLGFLMFASMVIFITMYCVWVYVDADQDTKNAYLGTAIGFTIIFVITGILGATFIGRGTLRESHIREGRRRIRRAVVGDSYESAFQKKRERELKRMMKPF